MEEYGEVMELTQCRLGLGAHTAGDLRDSGAEYHADGSGLKDRLECVALA